MSDAEQGLAHAETSRRTLLRNSILAASFVVTYGSANAQQQELPMPINDDRDVVWTPIPVPEQVTQTEGMVDVGDGVELWYWDTRGDGPAVVLMHAGTGSAAMWGYQQPAFARRGYRVIAYSRRGHYKSSQGSRENPGNGAEDLDKLLVHLNLQKIHLVAAAHGGSFAIDYVLVHPEKAQSLTILSSLMGIRDPDYTAVNARIRPKFFADLPHSFQELGPSYRAGDPDGVALWEALVKEAVLGTRVEQKLGQPLTWRLLETIRTPTLLMTGGADLYVPPVLLRMQAEHIRHAEVRIIGEAGHWANWERPDRFNELVLGFLDRNRV